MDLKISQFPRLFTPNATSIVPVVQSSANYSTPISSFYNNSYAVALSGSIVLGDPNTYTLVIDEGLLQIKSFGTVIFSTEDLSLNDLGGIPSIYWDGRQLWNSTGNPVLDWSGTALQVVNKIGASYVSNEAASCPLVSILSAINSQTVVSRPYYDETHVILATSTLSALTWALPSASVSRVGQIKTFYSNQNITTLTVYVSGGGVKMGVSLTTANSNESYSFQCIRTSLSATWLRLA